MFGAALEEPRHSWGLLWWRGERVQPPWPCGTASVLPGWVNPCIPRPMRDPAWQEQPPELIPPAPGLKPFSLRCSPAETAALLL